MKCALEQVNSAMQAGERLVIIGQYIGSVDDVQEVVEDPYSKLI